MSWHRTTTATGRASFRRSNLDLAAHSHRGLGQRQVDGYANIPAAGRSPPTCSTESAKATAKELLEDVVQTTKVTEQVAGADLLSAVKCGAALRI